MFISLFRQHLYDSVEEKLSPRLSLKNRVGQRWKKVTKHGQEIMMMLLNEDPDMRLDLTDIFHKEMG